MNIKKIISVFTGLCFIFSVTCVNLTAAVKDASLQQNDNPAPFAGYGKITEIHNAGSGLLVINIQDLHSNKSVQSNINNILKQIDLRYGIKNIFVEGGYGSIDTSWLNSIEDKNLRDRVADELISMGRLTGAEYFAYKENRRDILKGLDDEKIHKENLARLSEILDKQDFFNAELKKIKSDINYISGKYSSEENLKLTKLVDRYASGKTDTKKFYKLLFKTAAKINDDPQKYNSLFPINTESLTNINKYLNLSTESINNKKLSSEINSFLLFIKGKNSFEEYNNLVNETNNFSDINKLISRINVLSSEYKIDMPASYPELTKFLKSNALANTINPLELLKEERILLNSLRQAFSANETEYEISFLTDFYSVFKDFMTNKLTAANYEYFSSKERQFINIYSKYSPVDRMKFLSQDIEKLDRYYSANNQRNEIFLSNILNGTVLGQSENGGGDIFKQAREIKVVISGGYHTKGLTELLTDRKISCVTITPEVNSDINQSEKEYSNIIKEQLAINTNALSFTIASCTNDVTQFNNLINAGINLLGGTYSQELINKVVAEMKAIVKEPMSVIYSGKRTVISINDKKIILENVDGKIENITGAEETAKPSPLKSNSFINEFFEKNPSLSFANGLSYKLRNIEKFKVEEIDGIDLAVIARLPSFIQDFFYTRLPEGVQKQLEDEEEINRKTILKENDKLPKLYEELKDMLTEQIAATKDFEKFDSELLPEFVKIINSRLKDSDEFIIPLEKSLQNLLKTNITEIQAAYTVSLLKYIYASTGKTFDAAQVSDIAQIDGESAEAFTKKIKQINQQGPHLLTVSTPLLDKITGIKNDTVRDYLLLAYHIVIAPFVEAPMINKIFDNTAKVNIPMESSLLPELFLRQHIEFRYEDEESKQEQESLRQGLYSVIDSMSRIYNKFYSKTNSRRIASLAAKITNIISHSKWNKEQIYSLEEELPANVIPFAKKGKSKIQKAIITGAAVIIILTAGIYGYNTFQTIHQSNIEITQMQQDLRISQAESFDNIIKTWLTSGKLTEQDITKTNNLQKYIQHTIKTDTEESFYMSLFQIRKDITSSSGTLMASMDDSHYVDVYRYVLNKIDDIVSTNLDTINESKNLKKEFNSVYGEQEKKFLEIASNQYDSGSLIETVNSNSDMKYRFYAYMLLSAKDDYQYNKNDFSSLLKKDDIIKYLKDNYFIYTKDANGKTKDISFADVENRYEWQVMCGMSDFLINGDSDIGLVKENFKYIFENAEIVKASAVKVSNAGLLYAFQSGTNMTAPIFVAAHEMSHIQYLNILGWSLETIASKTAELYAYLGEENIVNDFGLSSHIKTNVSLGEINNATDEYDIAFVVMMKTKEVCGIDSLNLLQESILEYLSANRESSDIQTTLKDILTAFAGKQADKEISEGVLNRENKETRIQEIINNFFKEAQQDGGASVLGSDFQQAAHLWEWIYNLPFSAAISSVIKRTGIKSLAKKTGTDPFELKKLFNKQIGEGKHPVITVLADSLFSIASIGIISYGLFSGIFPLVILTSVVYSSVKGFLFAGAHSSANKALKKKLFGSGTLFTAASIFPAVTALIFFSALSAAPLIPALTVLGLFISGQIAAAKIHRLYNASGKINDANLSYAEQLFKKEHKYSFKKFQRIMFIKSDKGLFASYKRGLFKKTETVFIPAASSKEEAYVRIKGLVTDYIKTDLKQNVHYYTKFFKKDVRRKILNPLFEYSKGADGSPQYGFVLEMLKTKIKNNDRTFRFWSCGSSTGEELRTFIWLVRKALESMGENLSEWQFDFVGTDNNKLTAKIASEFTGQDTIDGTGEKVRVNTEGFNIEYVILNHVDDVDLDNWIAWQKEKGGFDLVCQLNNPTPQWEQEAVAKNLLKKTGIYVHSDRIYDPDNKEIKTAPVISPDDVNAGIQIIKSANIINNSMKAENFYNSVLSFFKSITGIFSKQTDGVFRKVGIIYRAVSLNQINNTAALFGNIQQTTSGNAVLYENICIIKDHLDAATAEKLNLQPLGLRINGNETYISVFSNIVYLYAENTSFDDIINAANNNADIRLKVIEHINALNKTALSADKTDFVPVKIVQSDNNSVSQNGNIVTIYTNSDIYSQQSVVLDYNDVTTRYGFAVRESIFRYMDDFAIKTKDKTERMKDFKNMIDQQKNISCQLILDYDAYAQLSEDFGQEQFKSILEQTKQKNISIHIFITNAAQKEFISGNKLIAGFVEMTDETNCLVTDSLTGENTEAKLELNCDTVTKIISAINGNISKQPIIFKNSLLTKAVNAEQDTTLSGRLKDIFAFGKISNIISEVKEKRFMQKITETYSIESLSKSFTEKDVREILAIYQKWSLDKQQTGYEQIAGILSKNDKLKQFFNFNKYAFDNYEKTAENNADFMEQITYRIAAALELMKHGKEIGLKNKEYESVLAKAIKVKFIADSDNKLQNYDKKAADILYGSYDELTKEKMLQKYLDSNIINLSQRAFQKNQDADIAAVNTLIMLIPYAEAADIQIDVMDISFTQYDLRLTKQVLSAA